MKIQVEFKPIERLYVAYVGFVIGIVSQHPNRPLSPQNFCGESEFVFSLLSFQSGRHSQGQCAQRANMVHTKSITSLLPIND